MGFELDEKAFRAQNLQRPAGQLVRELLQNVFDEDGATRLTVDIKLNGRFTEIRVEDDVLRGFTEPKQIWTIFASGKKETPTKRGRMGRGLKEMIAVSRSARVETVGKTVEFSWNGKEFDRQVSKNSRERGTLVTCEVSAWKQDDVTKVTDYLRLFIPPRHILVTLNGETIAQKTTVDSFEESLPTILVEEEVMVQRIRKTEVRLYEVGSGGTAWIYEMGIPIEPIKDDGFPYHIDVQQRVPLKPERDVVPRSYLKQLFALIANHRIGKLNQEQVSKLWLEEAVSSPAFDKEKAGQVYITKRFGDRAVRANPMDPDNNVRAVQEGLPLVDLRGQTEGVRDLLRAHTPTVTETFKPNYGESETVDPKDWSENQKEFASFLHWLGDKMEIGHFTVRIYRMDRDRHCASWDQSNKIFSLSEKRLGSGFFKPGNIVAWVSLAVHELGHRKGNGHDEAWHDEVTWLSGMAFRIAAENVAFLREKGWL